MANLKGLVFVCYLSARHRPSQVTATPQPICVITTAFSHFPDNVLPPTQPPKSVHPFYVLDSLPSLNPFFPPPPSPCLFFLPLFSISLFYSLFKPPLPLFSFSLSHPSSPPHYSPLFLVVLLSLLSLPTLSLPFSSAFLTSESVGF